MDKLVPIAALVCSLCLAAGAHSAIIEAESFVSWHDEGGNAIARVTCGAASGGEAVEGFDHPGDWIEVVFELGVTGSLTDTLRSAGLLDSVSTLRSTVYGCGPSGEDLVSSYTTTGLGIY